MESTPPIAYTFLVVSDIVLAVLLILVPLVSRIGSPSLAATAEILMASASPLLPFAINTLPTAPFILKISLATLLLVSYLF